jgi:hypothetical protein
VSALLTLKLNLLVERRIEEARRLRFCAELSSLFGAELLESGRDYRRGEIREQESGAL